mgnify:CR=1 FL=1
MNGADTAWIIVATALVLFMTLPGLALFYGGLVRARNVLSVFMHCYAIACLMSILWLAFGYSIAFGGGDSGLWGGLDKMFLNGVTADSLSGTLPEVLFFAFQMTFAIITPALIVGAYVERVGFAFVLTFSGLWMLLCYAPVVVFLRNGSVEQVRDCVEMGFDDVINVPAEGPEIATRLAAQIGREKLYIETRNYIGPDRHRLDHLIPTAQPRKAEEPHTRLIILRTVEAGVHIVRREGAQKRH